jgi:hypothetical protein
MRSAIQGIVDIAIAAVVLSGVGLGQTAKPAQADPNMACVERIEIPKYPRRATQARIQGTITASVLLNSQGSVKQVDTEVESRSNKPEACLERPSGRS